MARPVLSFLTDFGPDGPAPICRGVMLTIAPDAQIVLRRHNGNGVAGDHVEGGHHHNEEKHGGREPLHDDEFDERNHKDEHRQAVIDKRPPRRSRGALQTKRS